MGGCGGGSDQHWTEDRRSRAFRGAAVRREIGWARVLEEFVWPAVLSRVS